jgi:hypothetical protein
MLPAKNVEYFISRAEIFYKEGSTERSIAEATRAVELTECEAERTALRIFIARGYSKLGDFNRSNKIYRALISENVFLPPIMLGLFYNSIEQQKTQKSKNNSEIIKLYIGEP